MNNNESMLEFQFKISTPFNSPDANKIKAFVADMLSSGQAQTIYASGDNNYQQKKLQNAISPKDNSKLNGGGSKPASDKQVSLIRDMANKKKINAEELVYNRFNKAINDLCGNEANEIIKELK